MPANLYIASAGPEQIPLIQELTLRVWPQTYASILSDEQIAYMLDQMYSTQALLRQMEEGDVFCIAWQASTPLGFASFGLTDEAGTWQLHKLYVRTDAQQTGAGKALLWHVCDSVKTQGATSLILQVNRQNERAVLFYERMGFHKQRAADFDIGNNFRMEDYVMELVF
ncbi:MAG TPA: GNAT family N-acetyltransferase [Lacibacter sp.]|nr:GNAT family N-acetyltransferase [Lacibacter sp.]HMO88957.1 GNAT family N-acetyltransferase [Lacibacter sp.]HMP87367.1 GNAT family N-acetyltransferase [Lacibacter sp.]